MRFQICQLSCRFINQNYMTPIIKPKKIGVDGTALVNMHPTGVELATTDLLQALFRVDRDNQYLIYTPTPLPINFKNLANVVERIIPPRRFWTQTALPKALKQDNLDVFWSPSNILPPKQSPKYLTTLHDIAFVIYPHVYKTSNRLMQMFGIWRAKHIANKIIVSSATTKQDLYKHFKIPLEKMQVVSLALPNRPGIKPTQRPAWEEYLL